MALQFDDPMSSVFADWPLQAQALGLSNQPTAGLVAPIPTRVEIAPAPDGTNAYRCTIDPNDTPTYSGIRAHVAYMRETAHNNGGAAERWYRWEMFFPADFDAVDMLSLCQVHDTPDGGEGTVKFPNFEVMVQGEDIWIWTPLAAPTEAQTPRYPTGRRAKVIRGRWVTIAIHSNWSKLSDGFLEVYFDNELMVREWNRPCSYDDAIAPYWIIGMYDWEHKGTSLAHQYRVWYRNAKVYNTGHTAHEVLGAAPRIAPVPVLPLVLPHPDVVYQGPFNIDDALISARGSNVFTGNWESQTFAENSGSIINVNTAQPVIIENCRFRSRSQHACVRSLTPGSQITVRNCIAETLNPNVADQAAGYFVKLGEPGTVVVENNTISGSGGVLIVGNVAMTTVVTSVRIRYNKLRNIDGRKSDGAGGYVDELSNSTAYFMARQVVQFDKITCADAIIDWNDLIDTPLQSRREDAFNFGNSKGAAGSYILVRNNYIGGGWTAKPFANTYSGCGLLTENASQYIEFRANRVVNASNMAAHMAGGSHYRLIDNRIVSTNKIDGTYVFVANGSCVYSDGSRTYVEATGNRYSWTRAGDLQSAFTITAGTGNVNTDNVQLAVPATTAMEQAERDLWLADAAAAGVTVGSSLV